MKHRKRRRKEGKGLSCPYQAKLQESEKEGTGG